MLAECRRIDEIKASQVEGASWSLDKDKRIYSVDEYNEMLAAYKAARKAYIERYKAKLETIDMVREKIRKLEEEGDRLSAENDSDEILEQNKLLIRRLEEMGKFGELEYELEFRLRHTYINPETGEQEYRPDDDVGEGLICVGSRDHNPKREDFDD